MLLISISASAQTGSIGGGTRGKGLKLQGQKRAIHYINRQGWSFCTDSEAEREFETELAMAREEGKEMFS
jgi:hypothetical protein